ncbi:MAG: hypothetical protein M1814_006196 [Vezdaea aestivalis]|nr:MAG: hypothetical protein M1814_006196 [Vezdaea aestivalis]
MRGGRRPSVRAGGRTGRPSSRGTFKNEVKTFTSSTSKPRGQSEPDPAHIDAKNRNIPARGKKRVFDRTDGSASEGRPGRPRLVARGLKAPVQKMDVAMDVDMVQDEPPSSRAIFQNASGAVSLQSASGLGTQRNSLAIARLVAASRPGGQTPRWRRASSRQAENTKNAKEDGRLSKTSRSNHHALQDPPIDKLGSQMFRHEPSNPNFQTQAKTLQETLKEARPIAQSVAIGKALMDDPTQQKSLSEAVRFRGTCQDMCPQIERMTRIAQKGVDSCEQDQLEVNGHEVSVPIEALMVKRFERSSAGKEKPLPQEIRALSTLKRTIIYLLDDLVPRRGLVSCYGFLWDRTRAIRSDLSLQMPEEMTTSEIKECVYIFERIVRFHIVANFRMARTPPKQRPDNYNRKQDAEQLASTMVALKGFYECLLRRGELLPSMSIFFQLYVLCFPHEHQTSGDIEVAFSRSGGTEQLPSYLLPLREACQDLFADGRSLQQGPAILQNVNARHVVDLISSDKVPLIVAMLVESRLNILRVSALSQLYLSMGLNRNTKNKLAPSFLQHYLHFDDRADLNEFLAHVRPKLEWQNDGKGEHLDINKGTMPMSTLSSVPLSYLYQLSRRTRGLMDNDMMGNLEKPLRTLIRHRDFRSVPKLKLLKAASSEALDKSSPLSSLGPDSLQPQVQPKPPFPQLTSSRHSLPAASQSPFSFLSTPSAPSSASAQHVAAPFALTPMAPAPSASSKTTAPSIFSFAPAPLAPPSSSAQAAPNPFSFTPVSAPPASTPAPSVLGLFPSTLNSVTSPLSSTQSAPFSFSTSSVLQTSQSAQQSLFQSLSNPSPPPATIIEQPVPSQTFLGSKPSPAFSSLLAPKPRIEPRPFSTPPSVVTKPSAFRPDALKVVPLIPEASSVNAEPQLLNGTPPVIPPAFKSPRPVLSPGRTYAVPLSPSPPPSTAVTFSVPQSPSPPPSPSNHTSPKTSASSNASPTIEERVHSGAVFSAPKRSFKEERALRQARLQYSTWLLKQWFPVPVEPGSRRYQDLNARIDVAEIFLPAIKKAATAYDRKDVTWSLLANCEIKDDAYFWFTNKLGMRDHDRRVEVNVSKKKDECKFSMYRKSEASMPGFAADQGAILFACSTDFTLSSNERFKQDRDRLHALIRLNLKQTKLQNIALMVVSFGKVGQTKESRNILLPPKSTAEDLELIYTALEMKALSSKVLCREIFLVENDADILNFPKKLERLAEFVPQTLNSVRARYDPTPTKSRRLEHSVSQDSLTSSTSWKRRSDGDQMRRSIMASPDGLSTSSSRQRRILADDTTPSMSSLSPPIRKRALTDVNGAKPFGEKEDAPSLTSSKRRRTRPNRPIAVKISGVLWDVKKWGHHLDTQDRTSSSYWRERADRISSPESGE